jgi:hypothetical protein
MAAPCQARAVIMHVMYLVRAVAGAAQMTCGWSSIGSLAVDIIAYTLRNVAGLSSLSLYRSIRSTRSTTERYPYERLDTVTIPAVLFPTACPVRPVSFNAVRLSAEQAYSVPAISQSPGPHANHACQCSVFHR